MKKLNIRRFVNMLFPFSVLITSFSGYLISVFFEFKKTGCKSFGNIIAGNGIGSQMVSNPVTDAPAYKITFFQLYNRL